MVSFRNLGFYRLTLTLSSHAPRALTATDDAVRGAAHTVQDTCLQPRKAAATAQLRASPFTSGRDSLPAGSHALAVRTSQQQQGSAPDFLALKSTCA